MKRIITVLCVMVGLVGLAAVPVQAEPKLSTAVILNCLTRTSTQTSPGSWRYIMSEGWWQVGPLHASAGCGGYVLYRSDGWRFDMHQCGQVWGRRPAPNGTTYIVPGSVRHVCGGDDSVVVMSRCRCQTFWLESWPYLASDRNSYTWNAGVTFF